jgi:superfamily II helicase
MERSTREGGPPMPLTIVFVERKNRCDEVAQALAAEGVPAAALHGGLSQVRLPWHITRLYQQLQQLLLAINRQSVCLQQCSMFCVEARGMSIIADARFCATCCPL